MAAKEKPSNPYAELFDTLRKSASDGMRAQSKYLYDWSQFWPRNSEQRQGWLTPLLQMQHGWADAMVNLAKNQQELIDQQFDTAIRSFEAIWQRLPTQVGKPAPSVPTPAPAPAAVVPTNGTPASVDGILAEIPAYQTGGATNIAQRVAIVTGAASGIGAAVAHQLASRGARAVVLVDLSDKVNETAEAINKEVGREVADVMIGDTSDGEFRSRVFDEVSSRHGLVRICVPAAGITRDNLSVRLDKETGKASIYSIDDFRKVTEINLIAPIYWAMEMVARIAEDRRRRGLKRWEPDEPMEGAIVFLGSVSSQGNKGQISYAVAKAGLEGAGATLMKEAIYYGVRCGIIHPGFTDTPMARALGQEFLDKYVLPYTQLRRLIRPEEIADAVCFMISNSAVSGELWADAGWHPPA
ncbi:SDR family NAD(P)-dependent oxidoreductase [Aeoliella mucimassa]|uniref:3-oxoacyl-[acyl-carrier-protein] reductase FabG n=1 Tax=Aeoliella mucimassa TaxID=2527972 RepID=A0A518AQ26_9BACT|nr:SDR family oxidoreductase [Aeoliella mucimassa]QDU56816.1 3-oxoacyl-[acyl-carrier-protein] reductase FabG [Aeoliella mucimassa]